MATRFYLPSSGTSPLPSLAVHNVWGSLGATFFRAPTATIKAQNSALTDFTNTFPSTTTQYMCLAQWVSAPIEAHDFTVDETVKLVVRGAESGLTADASPYISVRVVGGDGTTVRGEIGGGYGSSEFVVAAETRIKDTVLSAVSAQAGDRIVIELGARGLTPSIDYTWTERFGDPASVGDFALTDNLTTDLCPWVELSPTLTFVSSDFVAAGSGGVVARAALAASGINSATYASQIDGLSPGTHYYVRAYATNPSGTDYGDEVDFITDSGPVTSTGSVAASATLVGAGSYVPPSGTGMVSASATLAGSGTYTSAQGVPVAPPTTTLLGADLRITDKDDASVGYVFDQTQPAVLHTATSPNVPLNAAMSTPTQPGGQYDVRDTEGDKAITHLDWVQGEGQKTLDSESSVFSRYLASSYVDVSTKGQLKLLRPVVSTEAMNSAGPIFSACGYIWLGGALGTLQYTNDDGVTWNDATIGGTAINSTIGGFATDGTSLYFCVPGGDSTGIWSNKGAAVGTFEKFGETTPADLRTTAPIEHMAYNGGFLFAATALGAGLVNSTTGVYTQSTPAFLNGTNQSVALVSAGNAVYWVVGQNGRSYIYKLTYDSTASTMLTEQAAEFPASFIATCAVGYLSNVDVAGYFESQVTGVGKGVVYRFAGGMSALLFEIGDEPEKTEVPADISNDNRIRAACIGVKDEYFLTERACYRWDIDDGGHSHVFDFIGAGSDARITTETASDVLPTGGTITTVGQYTIHTFTGSGTLVCPPRVDKYGNLLSPIAAEVLVVAGGGGASSGGGGGGGYLTGAQELSGSMDVTVGDGGVGGVVDFASGTVGADSVFGSRTAKGGGCGGKRGWSGDVGGSGGGGGMNDTGISPGGAGTSGQGYAGGSSGSLTSPYPAGGGGGAGGVGGAGQAT